MAWSASPIARTATPTVIAPTAPTGWVRLAPLGLLLATLASTPLAHASPHDNNLSANRPAQVAKGAPSSEQGQPKASKPFDPKRGLQLMRSERFGPLHLGLDSRAVVRVLGRPEQESPDTLEAATGLYVRDYTYSRRGIVLHLSSPKRLGLERIASITLAAPCTLRSTRKIGIGSPVDAVRRAYADSIDPATTSSDDLVVGSVYGGIIFHVADGKVTRLYVGAGAE
jgi:hypothetical protein